MHPDDNLTARLHPAASDDADPTLHSSRAGFAVAPGRDAASREDITPLQFILPAAPSDGERPSDLPAYEILRELGRGGMSVVFLARQVDLDRLVAIKQLLPTIGPDPTLQQRFETEARVIAQLQHRHIVQVFEVRRHNQRLHLILEYLSGGSFAHQRKPLNPADAATLIEKLAMGVQAAHAKGIIHRDLKPANILFTEAGEPKITDFGLAKILDSKQGPTLPGEAVGTPIYMAPEQAAGQSSAIGPGVDIHALGVLLYECLTGRPPFQGVTTMETLAQVVRLDPVPVSRLNPGVPLDLETICLKCLNKEPGRRYESAGDLAADLRRFLNGEPIKARPLTSMQRMARWCRRNPLAAGLSCALLVGLMGGLVVVTHLYLRAERHLKDALAKFQVARDAVDKLTTVGERLQNYPDIPAVREEMLREALKFHRQFLTEQQNDPEQIRQTANAHVRVADIEQMLGQQSAAAFDYLRGLDLLGQLVQRFPHEVKYQFDLGVVFKKYGIHHVQNGRYDEAAVAYRRGLDLGEHLLRTDPLNPDFRRLTADCLNNLGNRLHARGQSEEAEERFRRGAELREGLCKEFPNDVEHAWLATSINLNLAFVETCLGKDDQADRRFRAALERANELRKSPRTTPMNLRNLAGGLTDHAQLLTTVGRFEEAERQLRQAVAVLTRLTEDFPTVPMYRRELAHAQFELAQVLTDRHERGEAILLLQSARQHRERLVRDLPHRADFRREADLHGAYLLAWQGKLDGLAQAIEQTLSGTNADAESHLLAARAFGRAATLVPPDERQAWLDRAAKALDLALNQRFFRGRPPPRVLASWGDFAALQNHRDFPHRPADAGPPGPQAKSR